MMPLVMSLWGRLSKVLAGTAPAGWALVRFWESTIMLPVKIAAEAIAITEIFRVADDIFPPCFASIPVPLYEGRSHLTSLYIADHEAHPHHIRHPLCGRG